MLITNTYNAISNTLSMEAPTIIMEMLVQLFSVYERIRNQSTRGLKKDRFIAHQIKLVNEAERVSQACCTFSFSKS